MRVMVDSALSIITIHYALLCSYSRTSDIKGPSVEGSLYIRPQDTARGPKNCHSLQFPYIAKLSGEDNLYKGKNS